MGRNAKGAPRVSILSRTMCALYGIRPTPFLNPPQEENGFGPPGPPARGMIPLDPRLSLRGDGKMGFHSVIQYFPNMWGSGGAKPFSASGGIKNGAARFPYRAHPGARQYGNPSPPSGGPGGPKPFSSCGGIKNGAARFPYRAHIVCDNMETRGAPWRLPTPPPPPTLPNTAPRPRHRPGCPPHTRRPRPGPSSAAWCLGLRRSAWCTEGCRSARAWR